MSTDTRPDTRPGTWRRIRETLPKGSTLPYDVWAQRHRWIVRVLWLHVPGIFVYALARHQSLAASTVYAAIIVAFALATHLVKDHQRLSTILVALGLLTCSAELVRLSGGVIEMHFHYFVIVGVVTLYQDWWPFLVAIGYVVLQHGVAGAIDPSSVYDHASAINHPWEWAGIHGLFILAMSGAGIASWKLNESLLQGTVEREEKLSEAQEVASLGSWEWDLDRDEIVPSNELARLLGIRPPSGPMSPGDLLSCVHPDDRAAVRGDLARAVEHGMTIAHDFRVVSADGTLRWLHGRAKIGQRDRDAGRLLSGTALDITDRKQAESEMHSALSLLNATLESTADAILVVDGEGGITSFNQRFVEMWHMPPALLDARDDDAALAYVLGELAEPEAFVAKVRELYAQPEADSHDVIKFLDGRIVERDSRPQRISGVVVGRVWTFRDITEQRRLEDELAHQAFHDSLTNLANQALFRDRVGHALARVSRSERSLAVLFLDLDNFKTVNDSLGHTAGDELLVAVAERVRACLRATDTAARLGGDEFAVLLEDLAAREEAADVAGRMVAALQQPFGVGGREVFVGASVGIAYDSRGIDSDQLLRNADLAMYTAKRRGKDRFEIYEPEMFKAAVDRLEIEGDLRRALDRGELTLEYQPIITFGTSRIEGVEALVRWHHPRRGTLPPPSFIPLAEETGLIRELGRQVLSAACKQTRAWQFEHPADPPLSVAVNVSPVQLQQDGLLHDVRRALEESGLPPGSLVLEITEGAMMKDTDATIAKLQDLKTLGVRIAIDDFGTGYSSLSYLQRFPVDILKIDRTFVAGMATGGEDTLVRAIVTLAETLRLNAVAEGVETREQADALSTLGCRFAQGFYYARPMDAEALGVLLGQPALDPDLVRPA